MKAILKWKGLLNNSNKMNECLQDSHGNSEANHQQKDDTSECEGRIRLGTTLKREQQEHADGNLGHANTMKIGKRKLDNDDQNDEMVVMGKKQQLFKTENATLLVSQDESSEADDISNEDEKLKVAIAAETTLVVEEAQEIKLKNEVDDSSERHYDKLDSDEEQLEIVESGTKEMIEENKICKWCQKALDSFNMSTPDGNSFCSERCFDLYRRAAFKKNKSCDWCQKTSTEFLTFLEKETQYQFCNETCLTQFRIDLICRENSSAAASSTLKQILAASALSHMGQNKSASLAGIGQFDSSSNSAALAAMASAELWLTKQQEYETETRKFIINHLSSGDDSVKPNNNNKLIGSKKSRTNEKKHGRVDSEETKRPSLVKVKPDHFLKTSSVAHPNQKHQSSVTLQRREKGLKRMGHHVAVPRKSMSPTTSAMEARPKSPKLLRTSQNSSQKVLQKQLPHPPGLFVPQLILPQQQKQQQQQQQQQQQRTPPNLIDFAVRPKVPFLNGLCPPPLTPAPLQAAPRILPPPQFPQANSFILPPSTVFCPMPIFVPLPVPIPLLVPVPEKKYFKDLNANVSTSSINETSQDSNCGSKSLDLSMKKSSSIKKSKNHSVKIEEVTENGESSTESSPSIPDPRPSSREDPASEQRMRRRALIMDVPSSNTTLRK